MPKGSASDTIDVIRWALRVFGGVRVARVEVPGTGMVWGASLVGATSESGKTLIGYGASETEAVQALWQHLTGTKGTGIIHAGRLLEWSAGCFQEILK